MNKYNIDEYNETNEEKETEEKKFEELFRTAFYGKSKIPQIQPYYKPRPKPCCNPD